MTATHPDLAVHLDVIEVDPADIVEFDDDNSTMTVSDPFLNTIFRITEVNKNGTPKEGAVPINMCINSFSLDQQNNIAEATCQSDPYGIKHMVRTLTNPLIKVDPYLTSLEEFDFWGALNKEKAFKLEMISYRDAAKTKLNVRVTAPICQLISAPGKDDNGFRRLEAGFRPLRNFQAANATEKQLDHKIEIFGVNVLA